MYRNIISFYIFCQFSEYFVTSLYSKKRYLYLTISYETGSLLCIDKKYYIFIQLYIYIDVHYNSMYKNSKIYEIIYLSSLSYRYFLYLILLLYLCNLIN